MQLTAIEFPMALYLEESEDFCPLCGMSVYPSGNPCSRSHSSGVSLRGSKSSPTMTSQLKEPSYLVRSRVLTVQLAKTILALMLLLLF
jgi:hypothetical protein